MIRHHLFLLFALSSTLSSCSLLVKTAVNDKYPPVKAIDKKLASIQASNANIDTTASYAIETDLTKELVDTCSSYALRKSNKDFVLNSKVVDSISVKKFRTRFGKQELTLNSRQIVHLSAASNKWISSVDFYVSASSFPYYSKDTVYLNPYFNRIHVKKIHFKKCAFLTKLSILTDLVNSVFDDYLPNINGQIQNYYVTSVPIKSGGISIGSTLSGDQSVKVVHDDTIKWAQQSFLPSFLIDKQEVSLLLRKGTPMPAQPASELELASEKHAKRKEKALFDSLYKVYVEKFQNTKIKNFDSTAVDSNYLVAFNVSNNFLQALLDTALANLNFQFTYPIGYQVSGVSQEIDLGKPNVNCGCDDIVNNLFNCRGGVLGIPCRLAKAAALTGCYAGAFSLPGISTYMSFCVAMKALPNDFQWTIGSINGNAQANCNVNGAIKKILITDTFSNVSITKGLSVNGNINYDFNFSPFNKLTIGGTIFGILTQCGNLELKGSPSVNGTISNNLGLTLTKQQNGKASNLTIAINPFQASVDLSQSPGLAVLGDFKNYFTCNLGYSVIGIVFAMAQVVPDQIIPDKFRDYFDLLTKGKLDHTFEVKSFTIPLSFKTKTILGQSETDMMWGPKSLNSVAYFPPL